MASPVNVIVRDVDRGYKKLLARLKKAGRPRTVTVGIHGDEAGAPTESGATVGDVASIHEFGIGDHPERSFLRAWADAEREAHQEIERKMAESVVRGDNTVEDALEKMGTVLAADAQKFIQSDRVTPKTIKDDPDDNPTTLIQTAQLVGSITFEVEK